MLSLGVRLVINTEKAHHVNGLAIIVIILIMMPPAPYLPNTGAFWSHTDWLSCISLLPDVHYKATVQVQGLCGCFAEPSVIPAVW